MARARAFWQHRRVLILVTGTKRSGTSMWMQILIAAGFPAIGEAFPRRWAETLKDANPSGFYESTLRHGVYYRTNPHPQTGDFLFPADVQQHVVKVFIPGLVRSDLAYIHRVIATMRPWREYVASLGRLHGIEDEHRRANNPEAPAPVRIPAALEWWAENFALICDVGTRRYPVHVQTYDGLLADPAGVIGRVLQWLGRPEGTDAAVAAVNPGHRTQQQPEITADDDVLGADAGAAADELYDRVSTGRGLTPEFVRRLNELNGALRPVIRRHMLAVREDAARRRELRAPTPHPLDFDLLEGVPDDTEEARPRE